MGEFVRKGSRDRQVKVGIAGCGRMGLPMGLALQNAELTVAGFDVRADDNFDPLPMIWDPAAFMAGTTHLFTVVRDQAQTEDVLFGAQAMLTHADALEVLLVCSTLPPPYILDLRKRVPAHIAMIDAPMSGAQVSAQNQELTFILGGAQDHIDDVTVMLSAMGNTLHHMGPLGSGMTTKVLNNFVAASSTAATRTALDWAAHMGMDRARLLNAMHDSSGQTWFGTNFEDIEFAKNGHSNDNSIGILIKDVQAALACAPDGEDALADALMERLAGLRALD